MPRKRTGTIQRRDGFLRGRITVTTRDGDERVWIELDPKLSDARAKAIVAKLATELAGRILDRHQVAALKGQHARARTPYRTIADFADRVYLPARSHMAAHRVSESYWRNHILPQIGDEDVRTFGAEPLRRLVSYLDDRAADPEERFTSGTARLVWSNVRAFCSSLVKSKDPAMRVRDDNPALLVSGPDSGRDKAKQWLYPDELRKLLAAESTPLWMARLIATQVFTFSRPGEAFGLDWDHVDVERGIVRIDRSVDPRTREERASTKTGDVRHFRLPDCILPMLRVMHREQGGKDRLFDRSIDPFDLRRALMAAGLRRTELHVTTPTSAPIRVHDLRGTGISYCALAGMSDDEVRERAGHASFSTTLLYVRRGKQVSGAVGDPFGPLPKRLESSTESSRREKYGSNSADIGDAASGNSLYQHDIDTDRIPAVYTEPNRIGVNGHPVDVFIGKSGELLKEALGPNRFRIARLEALARAGDATVLPGLAICRGLESVLDGDVDGAVEHLRKSEELLDWVRDGGAL